MSRVMIGEHLAKLRLICGFASRFERRSCSPLLLPEIPAMVHMLCACQGTARLTRMAVLRARGIPPGTTTTETARLRPPLEGHHGDWGSSPKLPKLPKVPKPQNDEGLGVEGSGGNSATFGQCPRLGRGWGGSGYLELWASNPKP